MHDVNEIRKHEYDFMNMMSDVSINLIINTINKNYQKTLKKTSDYLIKNQIFIEHFDYDQNLLMHRIKIRLKISKFRKL